MLRINVTTRTEATIITLEGRLIGAWVDELASCWQRVPPCDVRPIRIDLDSVTFVDAAGKALLRALHAEGAMLMASGPMLRAIVDEIVAARSQR
jgi:anti-anti-sigma regulatory factor